MTGSRLVVAVLVGAFALSLPASALAGQKPDHSRAGGNGQGGGGTGGGAGADLGLTLADAPDPVRAGEQLTYTATIANNGPAKATKVILTDSLSSTVGFVSASGNRGAVCGLSGTTVTCTLSRLNAGASAVISIVVRPNEAGEVTNTASVSADQQDSNSLNNQAESSTTVNPPPPPPPPDPDPGGCSGDAWFLGIVYDAEEDPNAEPDPIPPRDDFVQDVAHFERYLEKLRTTYCIPAGQATILAFEAPYKDYAAGTEENLKAELRRMAGQATADSQLFVFLSSHGSAWSGTTSLVGGSACPPTRLAGSYAALGEGEVDDGFLDDCELGALLGEFDPDTGAFVAVDCSFCGGFSDSLTAASGTVPDGGVPVSSGVPGANRVVVTGCAMTTECFGSHNGGNLYRHLNDVISGGIASCDGWTAPAFPQVQGIDLPIRQAAPDGRCTTSEWFFAAVNRAYTSLGSGNLEQRIDNLISIQQQFRIKYGLGSLADDFLVF